jgi:hypothetical protein
MHALTLSLTTALIVGTAQAGTSPQACQNVNHYRVVELPFIPKVIARSGVVAGITELHRAVVWRPKSGVIELRVPEGFHYTEPVAVTSAGDVVVNAFDADGHKRSAFLYSDQAVIGLSGNQTWAHGSGATSTVVGEWVPDGKASTDAVYWSNAVPHSIGLCCGGTLKAVNEAGDMIGDAYDDLGHYHAFAWSAAHGQRIIDPAAAYSSAIAINQAGHILLQVGREAYLDDTRRLRRLDLAQQSYNSVQAMNDCDVVVGGYGTDSEHYLAFSWTTSAGFRDLNSLVPGNSGWKLQLATSINSRGEIVGTGELDGDDRGFLLIPQH